jgi:hypothetical protein
VSAVSHGGWHSPTIHCKCLSCADARANAPQPSSPDRPVRHLKRFGSPLQAEVKTTSTIAYTHPDQTSAPVGPTPEVVVVGEPDQNWTSTNVGQVRSADLEQDLQPWIAQVAVTSVSIYARPFVAGGIRRTALCAYTVVG